MTSTISQLHYSPLSSTHHHHLHNRLHTQIPTTLSFPNITLRSNHSSHLRFSASSSGGNSDGNGGGYGGGGGGDSSNNSNDPSSFWENFGLIAMFIKGWRERVLADPQFPFKVLMEEVVGMTSCVIGDMASRPNFGLDELDFVFSTLVVGSILNFTLMYLLAPTISAASSSLPGIFAACPASHMFEPGNFGAVSRLGTFVYKGVVFATVGFAVGLVGTAISNGLIAVRKQMDPEFETPNKAPPTVLNAVTWALHMGLSSNLRYQTLNGIESSLAKAVSPGVFKAAVVGLRCANNVLGGVSFVVLARLTGSQSTSGGDKEAVGVVSSTEDDKLVVSEVESVPSNHSTSSDSRSKSEYTKGVE